MAEIELGHRLHPDAETNLPYDILLNIIEYSDVPTQVNWACTSRALFLDTSRKIWHSLRIRSSEINAYLLIVSGQKQPNRADGIVHFLLESAYRRHNKWNHVYARDRSSAAFIHQSNGVEPYTLSDQLTTTLPASHVRNLEIDNQGLEDQQPKCSRFDMECVLPTLLRRLTLLRSFKYLGPLTAKSLAGIIQVNTLRVLRVRNGTDMLRVHTVVHPSLHMPWVDLEQDWSVLANLKGLRILEIGRMMHEEASGLARAVTALKLQRLHISCWGWEYKTNQNIFAPSPSHTSALILFLDALMNVEPGDGQSFRGLPATLEHLVLIDKYHKLIPALHQLIGTAAFSCENLKTLGITVNVSGKCYNTVSKMGLPTYDKVVGLGSWQQLTCDEEIKVLHQYRNPSGEMFQTDPYPRPLCNVFKTLDEVIAATMGPGNYRISMKFVCGHQFRSGEILVYPYEGERCTITGVQGPQAYDAIMLALAVKFKLLSLGEKH